MRNKLKLNRDLQKSTRKVRESPQTPCVIVLSDSSCSGEDAESHSSSREALKIAPIFLTQRKSQRGSDDAQIPPLGGDVVKKTAVLSHLTTGDRAVASSWRGKLSTSALQGFLQEIQKSSPEFPVQTVFSTLQKKTSEQLQENVPTGDFFLSVYELHACMNPWWPLEGTQTSRWPRYGFGRNK